MFINTASMYLGILDWLIEWLTTFLTWLIQWAIDILVLVFAEMFYSIGAMLMRFADLVQLMFKRLAGLGDYWIMGENGTTTEKTGDILLDLITNKSVLQVFLALSLIAVVMVVAGSIIQIVRTEYTTEGSRNSKAGVMGQALKSLMMFFIVPLACVFGVYISSFLLKAIDTATNVTGSSTISGQIFVAAASEANKAKMGDGGKDTNYVAGWKWASGAEDGSSINNNTAITSLGITDGMVGSGSNTEKSARLAILIDRAYAQGGNANEGSSVESNVKYLNTDEVNKCYNMKSINFIVLWFGGGLAFYMLLMAAFGMIMRLFKATVLFVIVPPVVGLMPLDGGNSFKQWRTKFISSVIGAYGTIVSLNLLFLIIPILNNVYIFPNETWYNAQNNFVHLLFTLVAMFMLKDSAKLIGEIIGSNDDAMSAGEGMSKKVGGAVAKTAMVGAGAGALVGGVAMKGIGAVANANAASRAKAGKGGGISAKIANSANRVGNKAFKTSRKGASVISGGLSKMANDFSGGAYGSTDGTKHLENKRDAKLAGRKQRADDGEEGIIDGIRHAAVDGVNEFMDKEHTSKFGKVISGAGRGARGAHTGGSRSGEAYKGSASNVKFTQSAVSGLTSEQTALDSQINGGKNAMERGNTEVNNIMGDTNLNNNQKMGQIKVLAEQYKKDGESGSDEALERMGDLLQKLVQVAENNGGASENSQQLGKEMDKFTSNNLNKDLVARKEQVDGTLKVIGDVGFGKNDNMDSLTNKINAAVDGNLVGSGLGADALQQIKGIVEKSLSKAKEERDANKTNEKLDAIIKQLKKK